MHQTLDPDIQAELGAVAARAGCELLHAEFKGGVLRIFLDRPDDGVTLGDCETVSKQLSAYLDVAGFDPGRYTLEVSSPGLDRQLYRPADYERFVGRRVRVSWRDPESGRKATTVGTLEAYHPEDGGGITLEATEPDRRLSISLEHVELARLVVEL